MATAKLPPFVLVIFGAHGDLTKRKLMPALFELFVHKNLPESFIVVGTSRTEYSNEQFRAHALSHISGHAEQVERFAEHLQYFAGDVNGQEIFNTIHKLIAEQEKIHRNEVKKIFYLATAPSLFTAIARGLDSCGLGLSCDDPNVEPGRVVMEKPFGTDLASAKELDQQLKLMFSEEQIFRIDHYLGKEAVQNLLAFRFANELFEPLWNNANIDNIQITAAESLGIENRGSYYDAAGAVRDFVQSHILQLVAHVAMEKPDSLASKSLQDERVKVLQSMKIHPDEAVFGQYDGYKKEKGIAADSHTETYFAAKCTINNERWAGVPFYIRTGKRMTKAVTEIVIQFKAPKQRLFVQSEQFVDPDVLTFRIQPDDFVSLRLAAKKPAFDLELAPVEMTYCPGDYFDTETIDAYQQILLDLVRGMSPLFIREDEIEASWSVVEPALKSHHTVHEYAQESWGPDAANKLLEKNDHVWWTGKLK